MPPDAVQSCTDSGTIGHGGPDALEGAEADHYEFTLWALEIDCVPLDAQASGAMVGFLPQRQCASTTAATTVAAQIEKRNITIRHAFKPEGCSNRQGGTILKPKVLIVEDETLIAVSLAHLVEGLGYGVIGPVATRQEALAAVAEAPADIALVDLNLADGPTGRTLAVELASTFGTAVMIVTANPEAVSEDDEEVLRVVRKPYTDETIAEVLEWATKRVASKAGERERQGSMPSM